MLRIAGGAPPVSVDIAEVVHGPTELAGIADKQLTSDLEKYGFHIKPLRTHFQVRSNRQALYVRVDGAAIPGAMTPCLIQGSPGHYRVSVYSSDVPETTAVEVELPLPLGHSGTLDFQVDEPRPLAGPVRVFLIPPRMTLSADQALVHPLVELNRFHIGQAIAFNAEHGRFGNITHTYSPTDASPSLVVLGTPSPDGLKGGTVTFHGTKAIGPELQYRVIEPGITLIRRAIQGNAMLEENLDQLGRVAVKEAIGTMHLSGSLRGFKQILLPSEGVFAGLPRSVWFLVQNYYGDETLDDTPNWSGGVPVFINAIRFTEGNRVHLGSGTRSEEIKEPFKIYTLQIAPGDAARIRIGDPSSGTQVFSVRLEQLLPNVGAATLLGSFEQESRAFVLEPGGRHLLVGERLEECSLSEGLVVSGALRTRFWQGPDGIVYLYPQGRVQIDGEPWDAPLNAIRRINFGQVVTVGKIKLTLQ